MHRLVHAIWVCVDEENHALPVYSCYLENAINNRVHSNRMDDLETAPRTTIVLTESDVDDPEPEPQPDADLVPLMAARKLRDTDFDSAKLNLRRGFHKLGNSEWAVEVTTQLVSYSDQDNTRTVCLIVHLPSLRLWRAYAHTHTQYYTPDSPSSACESGHYIDCDASTNEQSPALCGESVCLYLSAYRYSRETGTSFPLPITQRARTCLATIVSGSLPCLLASHLVADYALAHTVLRDEAIGRLVIELPSLFLHDVNTEHGEW
jgi:hypothetical protein